MSAFPAASDPRRFHLCEALAVLALGGRSPALFDYARHALDQQGTEDAMAEARMLRAWVLDAVTRN